MKKNVGSQDIGAQMITAASGADFTGAVTCYRSIDGAAQAIGDTASGACAHLGNGYHAYVPSATDCNGDHIAFTFIGSGAISTTVQVYTGFPQTVDNATLATTIDGKVDTIGTDTAATQTLAAGVTGFGAINTDVELILADTGELQTDWVNGGRLDLILDSIQTDTTNIEFDTAGNETKLVNIKAVTDQMAFTVANQIDANALTGGSDATGAKQDLIQADLDTITGTAGVLLATGQTAAAWSALEASAGTMKEGLVEAGTLNVDSMSTNLTEPDDAFNGRILIFKSDTTTVALRLQATAISDFANTNGVLTFTAVTTAPQAGDSFLVV